MIRFFYHLADPWSYLAAVQIGVDLAIAGHQPCWQPLQPIIPFCQQDTDLTKEFWHRAAAIRHIAAPLQPVFPPTATAAMVSAMALFSIHPTASARFAQIMLAGIQHKGFNPNEPKLCANLIEKIQQQHNEPVAANTNLDKPVQEILHNLHSPAQDYSCWVKKQERILESHANEIHHQQGIDATPALLIESSCGKNQYRAMGFYPVCDLLTWFTQNRQHQNTFKNSIY